MFWSTNICRLCRVCSQNTLSMYSIFDKTRNIDYKLKRCMQLNVHKDDCKPKEICSCCYGKLNSFHEFLELCYESNNKFESLLFDDRRLILQEESWPMRVHPANNISTLIPGNLKTADNILSPDLSLLVKDNILELEPMQGINQSIAETNFTTIVSLNLDTTNLKQSVNNCYRNLDEYHPNQSVLRHSSEFTVESPNYSASYCINHNNYNYDKNDATKNKLKDEIFSERIDGNAINLCEGVENGRSDLYLPCGSKNSECIYTEICVNLKGDCKEKKQVASIPALADKCIKDNIDLRVQPTKNEINVCSKVVQADKKSEIDDNRIVFSTNGNNVQPLINNKKIKMISMKTIKNAEVSKEKPTKEKKSMPFSCQYCDKKFMRKEKLKSHLSSHTNVRPFICDICNKSFALRWDLTCHKRVHTNMYQCSFCKKSFSFKSKLDRHVRTHTNDRPFACTFGSCTQRFSDKRNLMAHKITHSEVKNFACGTCDKRFKTIQLLNQHHKVHDDSLPHTCHLCPKAYKYRTNLLLHLKKHNGYNCRFCKMDFQKLSYLLKHRKECKHKRDAQLNPAD